MKRLRVYVNRAHGWKLSRHLLLETSTVLGSSRRYLSFHVHGQRSPTLECISKTLGYASSRSYPFSRMDNRQACANRDKSRLRRIISGEEIAKDREDVETWGLNRGKFGLCRFISKTRLWRVEKRMVFELEMTYKNMARDLKVTRRNVKRKSR